MSKTLKSSSVTPVILEGDNPEELRREALRLASSWIWDERKVMAGLHVDVTVLDNGADALIKVDDIRALRRDSLLRPFDGEAKVYIIAHAQNMNHNAQNALLRILEEPPPYLRFVLPTSNAEILLPTIRSRCVVKRLLPGKHGDDEHSARANAFVDALNDPWKRMAAAYSWDKLSRDALKGVLNSVLACLRDRCLKEGINPIYAETLETVSKLLPALELNASVGSVCGVLASCPITRDTHGA
jgi:DNA polymerase III delta prime subunit